MEHRQTDLDGNRLVFIPSWASGYFQIVRIPTYTFRREENEERRDY